MLCIERYLQRQKLRKALCYSRKWAKKTRNYHWRKGTPSGVPTDFLIAKGRLGSWRDECFIFQVPNKADINEWEIQCVPESVP